MLSQVLFIILTPIISGFLELTSSNFAYKVYLFRITNLTTKYI